MLDVQPRGRSFLEYILQPYIIFGKYGCGVFHMYLFIFLPKPFLLQTYFASIIRDSSSLVKIQELR